MSKVIGGRFVEMADGRKILQLERELWGGEGSEWFTPETVPFDKLRMRDQEDLLEALGEDEE